MDLSNYKVKGEFTLSSGKKSTILYNMREAFADPIEVKKIIAAVDVPDYIDLICGIPTGGLPWATALSLMHNKPMIILHKEPKTHGTEAQVEGKWEEGQQVLLVDDVSTTGNSMTNAVNILEEHGLCAHNGVVLVNRCRNPPFWLQYLHMDDTS